MEAHAQSVNKASSGFLAKMYFASGGGIFLDGYLLVLISVALIQLEGVLSLNSYWLGLIGAGSLLGIFVGTSIMGYVTDHVGRKKLFIINVGLTAILSICQMFISSPEQLVALRLLIGMCVGADYSIGQPLLAEFAPQEQRGVMLGGLQVMWFIGACCANIVGYLLVDTANSWPIMLGSAAVPAILLFIVRLTVPESPYWLASKGRLEDAHSVLKKVYGDTYDESELDLNQDTDEADQPKASWKELLTPFYLKRVIFCGGFYSCAVLPLFAIYTFGPKILEQFNLAHGKEAMLGDMSLSMVFLIGCVLGLYLIDKFGRRPISIATYAIMTISIGGLSFCTESPIGYVMFFFAAYAIAAGVPNDMVIVYPNELFPTEIRATGVGVSTAISRIAAFIGTFFMPFMLNDLGLMMTLLLMTAVTAVGLLLCILLAPETKGMTLSEASSMNGAAKFQQKEVG